MNVNLKCIMPRAVSLAPRQKAKKPLPCKRGGWTGLSPATLKTVGELCLQPVTLLGIRFGGGAGHTKGRHQGTYRAERSYQTTKSPYCQGENGNSPIGIESKGPSKKGAVTGRRRKDKTDGAKKRKIRMNASNPHCRRTQHKGRKEGATFGAQERIKAPKGEVGSQNRRPGQKCLRSSHSIRRSGCLPRAQRTRAVSCRGGSIGHGGAC